MDSEKIIDTNIWIQLNKNSEIEIILYDYKNTIKYDIDVILKLTIDELQKVQDSNIAYEETFNELNLKYKNDILILLNKNKEEPESILKIIYEEINEILESNPLFWSIR